MSAFVALSIASWVVLLAFVVLGRHSHRGRKPEDWHVVTVPADKKVIVDRFDGDYPYGAGRLQLSQSVLVRVQRDKQSLTIAALDIGADDFDEQISNAQAHAHAKAASLNAYVGTAA